MDQAFQSAGASELHRSKKSMTGEEYAAEHRRDDDRLNQREPREQPRTGRGQQAAETDAQETRQENEIRKIRQQPDIRRHPSDQRNFKKQDDERDEEQSNRTHAGAHCISSARDARSAAGLSTQSGVKPTPSAAA